MKIITTHFLVLLFFLLLAIKSPCKDLKTTTSANRGILINSSFYIPAGSSVCIPENISVSQPGQFINDGVLFFTNKLTGESYFPSGNLGKGKFSFEGENDFVLNIEEGGAEVGSVNLDSRGSLFLLGNLNISSDLNLKRGLLNVNENNLLLINNTDLNSIQFDNSPLNKSYVTGRLGRSVIALETYYFPIGNDRGFHPIYLSDASKSGEVVVSFDETVSDTWSALGSTKPIELFPDIGWNIENGASSGENKFFAGLSLFDQNSEQITGNVSIFYSANMDLRDPIIDWNVSRTNNFYLQGSGKRSGGIYSFVLDNELKLPNFFLTSNSYSNHFEIPNASEYSGIELTVFNRLGSQIFTSNRYLNEFDTKDFPDGTYYYELILTKDGIKQLIRNFIEIRHEK